MSAQKGGHPLERLLRAAALTLERAGVTEEPAAEVRRMWSCVSGESLERMLARTAAEPFAGGAPRLRDWVRRRCRGEPLAYLEGRVEFHGLELEVDPRVLVPRADSEAVVASALAAALPHHARLADLGTGSGCLLLALLSERRGWSGIGVDRSAGALELARANAARLGLANRSGFLQGSWLQALGSGSLDLLVANPPYVHPGEPLGPGVAEFEPAEALFTPAGDPLAAYAAILADAPRVLRSGGLLVVEVGAGRAREVARACSDAGLEVEEIRRDLAGIERAVRARRP